jgi:hypothetical protein
MVPSNSQFFPGGTKKIMGIERTRELRRKRHRKVKLATLKRRAEKASKSEKAVIAQKIRRLSPGAEQLLATWKLV